VDLRGKSGEEREKIAQSTQRFAGKRGGEWRRGTVTQSSQRKEHRGHRGKRRRREDRGGTQM
jgi:hypothetical protein